jgi:hypothetical protein
MVLQLSFQKWWQPRVSLGSRHSHFAGILTRLAVANHDSRILPNRKIAQDRLHASEHVVGVCTKKEYPGFFGALPAAVVTVWVGSRCDLANHGVEIEIRVYVIVQARDDDMRRTQVSFCERGSADSISTATAHDGMCRGWLPNAAAVRRPVVSIRLLVRMERPAL